MRGVLVLRDLECIKAIAHPKRIDILKAFNNLPLSAKQISQMLDEPHAKINIELNNTIKYKIEEIIHKRKSEDEESQYDIVMVSIPVQKKETCNL